MFNNIFAFVFMLGVCLLGLKTCDNEAIKSQQLNKTWSYQGKHHINYTGVNNNE